MRLVVHDYSGHPGQVHLSRELARRGHDVEHQYCASYVTGRGATDKRVDDPDTLVVRPIALGKKFARYSPLLRVQQELQYSRAAYRVISAAKPDLVVLSNVPLLALFLLTLALNIRRLPYVFWQQDVYSEAIRVVARKRLRLAGPIVGWVASRAERRVARRSGAVVAISDAFTSQLATWRVDKGRIHVIPNWAAIDEMPLRPRDNAWAQAHNLVGVPVAMYAGTLGLKHDPSTLLRLAEDAPAGARVVVVSQGLGREWLESRAQDVPSLLLLDYQPYEQLPDMLASADVLIALLERDASRYSVPSKVLNYLCAGRPILASLSADNAVALMIESAAAGVVVPPGDHTIASREVNRLLSDSSKCSELGDAARDYAEKTFDVHAVGDHFEAVFAQVVGSRSGVHSC
ncbi:glycosyltransferase family 4 protein [Mycobacterium sp. CVI_P3]|uniref:Glycosyltransferase family 4 protein n=1 Tax=Mycobacterium pinniadriaticum TaxID=2994102 RepID=A0ABT3SNX0_9MYCO|nr:glycosyltransferase family 4 protein [Mycobacterium pinniadriaticum]MCX2934731.1 glycosyltransferase family 4 protein [Mycobacterium pinniadriaticum]MCX2941153.1 glycosyltransferase family 4 protein [Mycobacterium pinniadriaticum]